MSLIPHSHTHTHWQTTEYRATQLVYSLKFKLSHTTQALTLSKCWHIARWGCFYDNVMICSGLDFCREQISINHVINLVEISVTGRLYASRHTSTPPHTCPVMCHCTFLLCMGGPHTNYFQSRDSHNIFTRHGTPWVLKSYKVTHQNYVLCTL